MAQGLPLNASSKAYNPPIDGTWKNFVVDFLAPTNGTSDASGAVDAWLTWAIAHDGSKLLMPPFAYHFATTNALTLGVKNATISAYGASVDNTFLGNAPIGQDYAHSARIQTANVGDTSVTVISSGGTLVSPADVSLFSVGKWILIGGLGLQVPDSYPPNFQFFEFRKITGIAGSVISFSDALAFSYLSTWPYIDAFAMTINIGTSTATCTGHSLVEGQPTKLTTSGALPTGLTAGSPYYVKNLSGTSFQLSATQGGSPISLSGTQSGTHYYHANSTDLGGPASIYLLDDVFDGEQSIFGLRVTAANAIFLGGCKSMTIANMAFDGLGPTASVSKSIILQRCQCGSQNEIDKIVENVWYNQCYSTVDLKQLYVASAAVNNMVITNSRFTTINGSPKNLFMQRCIIGTIYCGPVGYGHGQSVVAQDCTVSIAAQGVVAVDPATLTYDSGTGTFSIPNASASGVWQWAVPNQKYFFAYFLAGVISKNQDAGGTVVSFTITAVRQDATSTYVDTDLVGALPTPTYSGNAPNKYIAYAAATITQTNTGPADLTQFAAP